MRLKIPAEVIKIYDTFEKNGYEIYFVGGTTRDLLLNREVKDYDLTTNATPEEILKLFPDGFYDNNFGTVGIPIELKTNVIASNSEAISVKNEQKSVVEVTTYRSESEYKDRRHPEIVEWGKTIEEDLKRRDFTINAIAMKFNSPTPSPLMGEGGGEGGVADIIFVDPYNGRSDLHHKVIRAVGNPGERFKEDALRLLRAVRLATQLSFVIDEKTLKAVVENAALLQEIAKERIRDEFLKILASDFAYDGIILLKNTNLLGQFLPELVEGQGVSQVRPGRHHTTDVFEHNLLALKTSPSKNPIVRFATLIHDIAKPRVAGTDQQGLVTFYNHEIVGAKMAAEIANRLRFSKKEKDKIVMLVRWHMFTVDEKATDAAIRRFIRRVGVENINDMIDVRIADRLGSGSKQDSWRFEKFRDRVNEQLQPAPFGINDLAIDGNDIMKALNIKPSRKVGEILQKLFEEVDEDLEKNNKEYLLKRITQLYAA